MTNLVSPWVNFYREVEALFEHDPDISITYNEDENHIRLYVNDNEKAEALTKILPNSRTFGNVTVKLSVLFSNQQSISLDLFQKAFRNNPAFSYATTIERIVGGEQGYVVFKNEVVQYFNDDIHDINGFRSTLYQDLASDVFGDIFGISFCTDTPEQNNG